MARYLFVDLALDFLPFKQFILPYPDAVKLFYHIQIL